MRERSIQFLKKNTAIIGFIIIIFTAIFLKILALGQNVKNGIILNNTLDFSWQLDIVERYLHGYLAGRDFIFTYGPLYQFITSIPSMIFNVPSFVSIIYAQLILLFIVCLLLLYLTKEVAKDKIDHLILFASSLFIINLISYPTTSDVIRILFPFFYSLIYFYYSSPNKILHFKTLLILAIPALFGLYTFDNYILLVLITIWSILYRTWQLRKSKKYAVLKRYITVGILHIGIIFIYEIMVSFFLTQNFNYLLYSLDTVKNYQYILSIPFSPNRSMVLLIIPLILLLAYIFLIKNYKKNSPQTTIYTLLVITAFLQIKSGIIRADEGHIALAIYPSALVLFWMIYYIAKDKKFLLLLLVLLYILLPGKTDFYERISKQYVKAFLSLNNQKNFFDVYILPHNYYYSEKDITNLAPFIRENKEDIMIYPYDNYILNTQSSTYNALPLLWYQYSNSLVEKKAIEKLQKKPPKYIILGIDNISAISLDDIPNIARNPLLFKWMLKNYSTEKNTGKFLILKYDPNKKLPVDKHITCDLYDVDFSKAIKIDAIEALGKPSAYFLISSNKIRLPYSPEMDEVLFINNFSKISLFEQLFARKFDFSKYVSQEKEFTIIRKNPLSITVSTTTTKFPVKCY